jgi:serine/threonine-protein kinase RsbW
MIDPVETLREVGRSSISFVPENKRDAIRAILQMVDAAASSSGGGTDWFDVKLAVEEVCMNLVDHGYGPAGGPIDVRLLAGEEAIVVTIRDEAKPFPPEKAPMPDLASGWEDRPVGGLGWHLIRKLMDSIEYESSPADGNRLTLVKRRAVPREN